MTTTKKLNKEIKENEKVIEDEKSLEEYVTQEIEKREKEIRENNVREVELERIELHINRRKMAYISLYFLIIANIWFMFFVTPEKIKVLDSTIEWLNLVLFSIIGSYMGFSVLDVFLKNKNK